MTRELKLALIVGFALVLVVTVLISDHLSHARQTELAGKRVRVTGRFELGTDFANNGNLAMSESNFARFFPEAPGPCE